MIQPCLPFLSYIHRWVTLSTWLLKCYIEFTFGELSYETQYFNNFVSHSDTILDIPIFSRHYHFWYHIPCNSLTIQPIHWPKPISWYKITCLAIFPSKLNKKPGSLPEVLLLRWFPFIIILQEHPRKGLYCRSCPLLDDMCTSHRII